MRALFTCAVVAMSLTACTGSPPPRSLTAMAEGATVVTTTRATGAMVTVHTLDGLTVHSFTSPVGNFAISTHIIESANALVLIDAQLLMSYADDFRTYAESLGKPIDRVLITHAHPDHYLGLAAFAEVPSFALADVKRRIAFEGEEVRAARRAQFGDGIAARSVPPRSTLATGPATIDGVRYVFEKVEHSEAETMLVTRLPDFGVMSIGDVASNGVHLFLANNPDPWIDAIRRVGSDPAYSIILPGHGTPGNHSMFDASAAWLKKAKAALATAKSGEEFRSTMLDAFPTLAMPEAIDFYLPALFPNDVG